MVRHFIFIAALFFLNTTFAQRIFVHGYVAQVTGDTLKVEILDTDRSNFKSVTYRLANSAPEVTLGAEQFTGYGIDGGRKFVSIAKTPLSEMPLFYEIVVSGKARLFVMDSRFMLEVNNAYYELKNNVKEELMNNKVVVRETFAFRGLLNYLFQDCSFVLNDIPTVTLSEGDLKKIVKKYNDCFGGSEKLDNAKGDKSPFMQRLELGAHCDFVSQSYSFENVTKTEYQWFYQQHPASTSFGFGLFAKYNFSERWWATVGVNSFNTSISFSSDNVNGTERKHNDMKYSSSNINIDFTIKYAFSQKRLAPYAFAGLAFGLTNSESSYRDNTLFITAGQNVIRQGPFRFDPLFNNSFSLGFLAGVGVKFKANDRLTPFLEGKFSAITGNETTHTVINIIRNISSVNAGVSVSLSKK